MDTSTNVFIFIFIFLAFTKHDSSCSPSTSANELPAWRQPPNLNSQLKAGRLTEDFLNVVPFFQDLDFSPGFQEPYQRAFLATLVALPVTVTDPQTTVANPGTVRKVPKDPRTVSTEGGCENATFSSTVSSSQTPEEDQ